MHCAGLVIRLFSEQVSLLTHLYQIVAAIVGNMGTLSPGVLADDLLHAPDLSPLASTYFGFHLAGGHIGLPILVLIFLCARRVQRPATVINFCVTWIIYSISYCLIIYGGHHHTFLPPPQLCLIQASMIHGAPPMAVVAGIEVVFQAWTTFTLPWQSPYPKFLFRLPNWLLVILIISPPYVVFLAFAITAALIAQKQPERIFTRSSLYCTIQSDTNFFERWAVPTFCALVVTAIVTLEAVMIVKFLQGWRLIRKICPLATRRPSISPWFRVCVFTCYSIATLVTCISFLSEYVGSFPYMVQAALPLVALLVFGSQSDILHVCGFGKLVWSSAISEDDNEIEYTPGGGWSGTATMELSPQLSGHLSLVSNPHSSWRSGIVTLAGRTQPSVHLPGGSDNV